ncbi:hypothetical protein [Paenibacillus crassostreae]|uniref:Nitroreductase domain-containing protein n=1 Tax=Paenibacillus crassostreae TaxID=1763538 RepID=A0A167EVC1_9BACL|nr:hypothetical protein [Paenibacillus crassostreae]AOZ93431.1 hypothetical protein LPB68_15290 [Paenibacillus crassostreae]OAB75914.1 hypothetical protein PNBC_07730 [Paenibacillus crassostreae]
MQENYIGWHSNINFNHDPNLDVLIRLRMKMLKSLFTRMNIEETSDKHYYTTERYGLTTSEMDNHPFVVELLMGLSKHQEKVKPFIDYEAMKALSREQDGPEVYVLSLNQTTFKYELFYCSINKFEVERVKEVKLEVWKKCFEAIHLQKIETGVVFITASIPRSIKLFGEHSYRINLLEGGRLTERLAMCVYRDGWELQPLMTFNDQLTKDLLEIDGQYGVVISCLIIDRKENNG